MYQQWYGQIWGIRSKRPGDYKLAYSVLLTHIRKPSNTVELELKSLRRRHHADQFYSQQPGIHNPERTYNDNIRHRLDRVGKQ